MMANMTLSIPELLHKEMAKHSEFRWSDIARQAFEKKIREAHWVDHLLQKSVLTEEDAERIGNFLKKKMRARFV